MIWYFADWNELFTTKCFACGFPVEAGDRWVEALNNNYHSQCFNCTVSITSKQILYFTIANKHGTSTKNYSRNDMYNLLINITKTYSK